jgi:AcrR family transcriptional regulator
MPKKNTRPVPTGRAASAKPLVRKLRTPEPAPLPEELALRERILQASVALIEGEGLAALSMREVARRAGVSHQAPYHHFADREAILGAIAERGFVVLRTALEGAIAGCQKSGSAAECLAACGQAYVEFACAHPAHFRVMFRPELVNLENCPLARAEGDSAFDCLTAVVREAVAQGLPTASSEEALIILAWSVAHGLACLILDGPLSKKMPDAERGAQIRGVTDAFGAMLAASIRDAKTASPERPRRPGQPSRTS